MGSKADGTAAYLNHIRSATLDIIDVEAQNGVLLRTSRYRMVFTNRGVLETAAQVLRQTSCGMGCTSTGQVVGFKLSVGMYDTQRAQ